VTWLWWVIGSFACYRLTVLFARDLGPWGVFKRLREIGSCSKLLTCPFCVSIYTGALVVLAFYLSGILLPFGFWIMLSLSFSSFAIILDRTFTADYTN
jgi:hypothetical protein